MNSRKLNSRLRCGSANDFHPKSWPTICFCMAHKSFGQGRPPAPHHMQCSHSSLLKRTSLVDNRSTQPGIWRHRAFTTHSPRKTRNRKTHFKTEFRSKRLKPFERVWCTVLGRATKVGFFNCPILFQKHSPRTLQEDSQDKGLLCRFEIGQHCLHWAEPGKPLRVSTVFFARVLGFTAQNLDAPP